MNKPKLFLHVCLGCGEESRNERATPGGTIHCGICGCELVLAPKKRKPFREVRVHDAKVPWGVSPDLVLEIYRNGAINIRESGRRQRYAVSVADIYVRAIRSAVAKRQIEKVNRKRARRAARR